MAQKGIIFHEKMFWISLNGPLLTRFELERAVAASINAGLSEVVGEKCLDAIVKLFLKNSGLKGLEDVVDCPERFEKFMVTFSERFCAADGQDHAKSYAEDFLYRIRLLL
jgi:hypothetical protein